MVRTRAVLIIALLLTSALASCSNSDDAAVAGDSAGTTTTAPSSTDAPPADTGDRNTFVSLPDVPGVSDDQIVFDVIGTRSNNPLGTCILDCYRDGVQAYFDFRNAEGGIYGRQLAIGDVLDDELAQNQVRSIDVISRNDAFGVFDATLLASGFAPLDEAGVPTFVWNIHGTEYADRPSLFGHIGAICADCTQRLFPYLVQRTGATKVATLGYGVSENSKVCTQSLRDSLELYADAIGDPQVVYFNDELAFGLPNGIGPEVTAMKQAGVQFIATCMDLNGMKTLGQELHRQGMDDVVLSHPNTYNEQFVADAGGIFDGDYVTPQFLPFEADTGNQMQAAFKAQMAANGKELSELAMVGWINADEAFTGLLRAGPQFDRQKVIDALNSITDYTAGGLVAPIDWTVAHTPPSRDQPRAQQCAAPVQVVDGHFETVADPTTPFLCWDSAPDEWTEPEQVAFGAD